MSADITLERIVEQVQQLPEESLPELARYIEFLRFKSSETVPEPAEQEKPLSTETAKSLDGILEGYDFSPELLAEVRREMWGNFGNRDI